MRVVALLVELAAQHAKATELRRFLNACRALPERGDAGDRWIAWGEGVLAGVDPLCATGNMGNTFDRAHG